MLQVGVCTMTPFLLPVVCQIRLEKMMKTTVKFVQVKTITFNQLRTHVCICFVVSLYRHIDHQFEVNVELETNTHTHTYSFEI